MIYLIYFGTIVAILFLYLLIEEKGKRNLLELLHVFILSAIPGVGQAVLFLYVIAGIIQITDSEKIEKFFEKLEQIRF